MGFALSSAGENEACATRALAEAPKMPRGPSFANTAAGGLDCALGAPKDAKWREAAVKASLEGRLESVEVLTRQEFHDRSLRQWLFRTGADVRDRDVARSDGDRPAGVC